MINMSSKFLYHAFTTLSGFQTLGEEYTNIVQVDLTLRRAPSLSVTIIVIFIPNPTLKTAIKFSSLLQFKF